MDESSFEELDFLVGWCPTCDREVLAYSEPDPCGDEPACVYCGRRGLEGLQAVSGDELAAKGYAPWSEAGCGGSGGCGSGGCNRR